MSILSRFSDERSLLADIESEAMANGNFSIRGVARLAEVDHKSIIASGKFKSKKLFQKLTKQGFEIENLIKNGFPFEACLLTLEYFAYKSKTRSISAEKSYCLLKNIPFAEINQKRKTKVVTRTEYEICKTFDSPYTQFEVKTLMGNIDILTPDAAIEAKTVKQAHNALGQILTYGHYYPNHQKIIILFGRQTEQDKKKVQEFKKICKPLKIKCFVVNSSKTLEVAKYEIITKNLARWELGVF